MIEAAFVYLIVEFPGNQSNVITLPMANMEICETEAERIEKHYKESGHTFRLWAHCVESGIENLNTQQ